MALIKVYNEYRKTSAPNEMDFGGAGPCFVVGAMYLGNGYIFHRQVDSDFEKDLDIMMGDLEKDVSDKDKLRIWTLGGEIMSFDHYKNSKLIGDQHKALQIKTREYVEARIKMCGFRDQIQEPRWCMNGYTQGLKLFLAENKAEVDQRWNNLDSLENDDNEEVFVYE